MGAASRWRKLWSSASDSAFPPVFLLDTRQRKVCAPIATNLSRRRLPSLNCMHSPWFQLLPLLNLAPLDLARSWPVSPAHSYVPVYTFFFLGPHYTLSLIYALCALLNFHCCIFFFKQSVCHEVGKRKEAWAYFDVNINGEGELLCHDSVLPTFFIFVLRFYELEWRFISLRIIVLRICLLRIYSTFVEIRELFLLWEYLLSHGRTNNDGAQWSIVWK